MANNQETKRKKPGNQMQKTTYFNTDDPIELQLYTYVKSIKNYSGYIKSLLYREMMQNNNQPPSPYQYGFGSFQSFAPVQETAPEIAQPPKVPLEVRQQGFEEQAATQEQPIRERQIPSQQVRKDVQKANDEVSVATEEDVVTTQTQDEPQYPKAENNNTITQNTEDVEEVVEREEPNNEEVVDFSKTKRTRNASKLLRR